MLDEYLREHVPSGWMVMSLAGPQHSDGRFYCCLRTTDPDGRGCAVAYADTAEQALLQACAKAKST